MLPGRLLVISKPSSGIKHQKTMNNHTYKKIEITGTSDESIENAIENAVARASHTVDDMRWFEVVETRGIIKDGSVKQWQVGLKIGFTLKEKK
jgi:flavin-binding protein dodecin